MTRFPSLHWDRALIQRYDVAGPRYTSYPTAVQLGSGMTPSELVACARETTDPDAPLSLYLHIPFCTHVCYYCACNKVITRNKKRAAPYLALLHREIAQAAAWYAGDRPVNQLALGGGTPTFISDQQQRELMATLRKHFRFRDDDRGDYSIEIDPRELGPDTLAVLRELGYNRVSFGVQDIEETVQQAVNRVQPFEMTASVLTRARALGFRSINLDLIYGLPHQTTDSFKRTLAQVITLQPDRLSIFNYAHLPDRFRSQKHINADDLPSPETKLEILENNIQQLTEAGYVYIGMDHFAKPNDELAIAQRDGCLHRNFQGYTTHSECELVAMGVSAISQMGDVYYQNYHDLQAYEAAIERHGQAIERGVRLNKDDKLRRQVITQLICHCELDIRQVEAAFHIDFEHYFADELASLRPLVNDGLLELHKERISVTPAGRLLIRRICMAFDAYLSQQQRAAFSRII